LKHEEHHNLSLIRVDEKDFIQHVAHDLFQRKIQSLIVEGGSQTLELFLESGLWDEARVFISPRSFGDGIEAPILQKVVLEKKMIGDDELMIYRNHQT
jgi:diaminohydroxyphosphoribosylaminopyrimidine deaminase/5-amino-6-(5-phosphoribosylamino)uracil reductase